jgi:hypothetical protein
LAIPASADNTRNYAVKSAELTEGFLVVKTTDGWTLEVHARSVDVMVDEGLGGTYINLHELPNAHNVSRAELKKLQGMPVLLVKAFIYVSRQDLGTEWQNRIREHLIQHDKPSDVLPEIKDPQ